jgi:hypothetical protein
MGRPALSAVAVLEDVGIGFLLEPDVREDIAAGRLVQLLADWTPAPSPLSLHDPTGATRRRPSGPLSTMPGRPVPRTWPGRRWPLSYTRRIGDKGGMAIGSKMHSARAHLIIVNRLNFGELPRPHRPTGLGSAA